VRIYTLDGFFPLFPQCLKPRLFTRKSGSRRRKKVFLFYFTPVLKGFSRRARNPPLSKVGPGARRTIPWEVVSFSHPPFEKRAFLFFQEDDGDRCLFFRRLSLLGGHTPSFENGQDLFGSAREFSPPPSFNLKLPWTSNPVHAGLSRKDFFVAHATALSLTKVTVWPLGRALSRPLLINQYCLISTRTHETAPVPFS